MLTKVKGGTGAGSRMHRARTVPTEAWTCTHGHSNPGFAATCLTARCRETRS